MNPKFQLHVKLHGVTPQIHLYRVIFNLCSYVFKNFKPTNAKVVLWGMLVKTSLCGLGFVCVNVGTYGKLNCFTIQVIVELRQSKITEVLSINQCAHLRSIVTVLLLIFGSLPTAQSAVPTNTFYSFHVHKYVFIPHKLDSTVNVRGVTPKIPRFFRTAWS